MQAVDSSLCDSYVTANCVQFTREMFLSDIRNVTLGRIMLCKMVCKQPPDGTGARSVQKQAVFGSLSVIRELGDGPQRVWLEALSISVSFDAAAPEIRKLEAFLNANMEAPGRLTPHAKEIGVDAEFRPATRGSRCWQNLRI